MSLPKLSTTLLALANGYIHWAEETDFTSTESLGKFLLQSLSLVLGVQGEGTAAPLMEAKNKLARQLGTFESPGLCNVHRTHLLCSPNNSFRGVASPTWKPEIGAANVRHRSFVAGFCDVLVNKLWQKLVLVVKRGWVSVWGIKIVICVLGMCYWETQALF